MSREAFIAIVEAVVEEMTPALVGHKNAVVICATGIVFLQALNCEAVHGEPDVVAELRHDLGTALGSLVNASEKIAPERWARRGR